jgi:Legionella pneumophila major outer membrane protein precursor
LKKTFIKKTQVNLENIYMNKKNLLSKVLLTLVGVLLATSSFAIPADPCAPKDVCCEEPAPGPFAFAYPKDVGLSCPRDFYAHGEFLWLKPSEEGLEFAMDQDASFSNIFPLTNGKIHGFSTGSKEWDWRPGFRVGFGFYAMHDAWNLQADWTYIRIKANSDVTNDGTGTLLNLWYPPIGAAIAFPHISAKWSGDFNAMDVMMGKPYHVSRYYISSPMFGIRAGWIDQDYLIRGFEDNSYERNVHLTNDYWGVGLRGYYEGQFLLGSGWYIYGKAAFALLFGKFDITQNSDNPAHTTAEYDFVDSFYSVQPNAEIGFGIAWSKFFNKNQYQVSLKVGYEFHHWWDQNQARKFYNTDPVANDTVSRGDLSFNGFMFGLHFEF